MTSTVESIPLRLRRRIGVHIADSAYLGLARAGEAVPASRPERHGLERIRDVPYTDSGLDEHTLDVYRRVGALGPSPIVIYVHGGAFRSLSKDTHWLMGLAYARRGYLVFNVNYRLAPRHRFPAAVEDVCRAYRFVARSAERYGGDLGRLVLAGESAGANLVTALALATCYCRPEPWARAVHETGVVPRAVVPACGLFQVSDCERLWRRRALPWWIVDQLSDCARGYLPENDSGCDLDLANPLSVLERCVPPERPLPAFYIPVGTRDPLIDDTRRLERALMALGARVRARYFPGEVHAFHALLWRQSARACWRETFDLLSAWMGDRAQPAQKPTGSIAPASGTHTRPA